MDKPTLSKTGLCVDVLSQTTTPNTPWLICARGWPYDSNSYSLYARGVNQLHGLVDLQEGVVTLEQEREK